MIRLLTFGGSLVLRIRSALSCRSCCVSPRHSPSSVTSPSPVPLGSAVVMPPSRSSGLSSTMNTAGRHSAKPLVSCGRFLGADAVVNRGDEEIGLEQDRIWCDAAAFQELTEAGEAERAMALYRGDLIEALHVPGAAPELSQWLDTERARLRRRAQDMAWRCVDGRSSAGDASGAIEWARRAVQLESFDERGLRRLLQLLDQAGEQGSAVQEYEQFAGVQLEEELEVRPAVETQALVASIRARLPVAAAAAPAKQPETVASPEPRGSSSQPALSPPRPFYTRRSLLLVSLFGLALALVLAASLRRERPAVLHPNLVAIMPWRVSGADPSLAYLREGMLDLLDGTLTGDHGLHAADPRTVLGAVNDVTSSPNQDVPESMAIAIAQQIGAGRIIPAPSGGGNFC